MEQPKFKGYSQQTQSWHYGYGWYKANYTKEYLEANGLPEQAILMTEPGVIDGTIDCDLASMAQMIGFDSKGNEVYTNDIIQPYNYEETYKVVFFEKGSLFSRYHFISAFEGKSYDDKNDTPLHLNAQIVAGTVYEMGIPYHKRKGTSFKYEVEYRK